MDNLETLKQELITQKNLITERNGTVAVANTNPSPSEITAGIKSITVPNLSTANATPNDVLAGKTFFSGNSTLQTGTYTDKTSEFNDIFISGDEVQEKTYDITLPAGLKKLRPYAFRDVTRTLSVTFNEDIEIIGDYSFQNCINTSFTNFSNLNNLKSLGGYCFANAKRGIVDSENLPSSIESISTRAFTCILEEGKSIIFPESLKSLSTYPFYENSRLEMNSIYIPDTYAQTYMPQYTFYQIGFNCDFVLPPNCEGVDTYFSYRSTFNNAHFHANSTKVGDYSFYAQTTDVVENFRLKTFVIEAETLPIIGKKTFATQHITNGLKIYVPDTVVEEYKAVSNWKDYTSIIYPISQME